METGLVLSKKLLLSSVFGIVVVATALYVSTSSKEEVLVAQETNNTSGKDTSLIFDLSTVPLNNPSDKKGAGTTEDIDNLSETDILTRNIFGPYIKQLQEGTYTQNSAAKIVQNATDYMFTLDYTPLLSKDILTTASTDYSTVKTYKNNLHNAMKPLFALKEYELTIYAKAVRDNSKEDFDNLASVAQIYKTAGDNTLAITSPSDVSAIHLAIVYSL